MGLIKAAVGATGGVLADQWKEFFYCDSMESDVLAIKGQKKTTGRSSNTKGNDNIISNGSVIAVADGQCMLIVEQGKIVDVCAEPGEFVYDASTEPSIFSGKLSDSIKDTFKTIGKRFTFGGDTGKMQSVYYINTKEILDNKFGSPTPIPFRVVDKNVPLDLDITLRCNGIYSYRITDPLIFYTKICSNIDYMYTRDALDNQLKTEFIDALTPGFSKLSELELRPSAIPAHTTELSDAINEILSKKWSEMRGISVVSIAMNPVSIPEEYAEMISNAQQAAMYRDPSLAAGTLARAGSEAMKSAASNPNGAMMGFMGMGMAGNAMGSGMNLQNLYAMGNQPQQPYPGQGYPQNGYGQQMPQGGYNPQATQGGYQPQSPNAGYAKPAPEKNEYHQPQPTAQAAAPSQATQGWTCSCGVVNKGKFCMECGSPKPAGALLYRCDKCGWEPANPSEPPRFCPECGDPFDENDIQ